MERWGDQPLEPGPAHPAGEGSDGSGHTDSMHFADASPSTTPGTASVVSRQ